MNRNHGKKLRIRKADLNDSKFLWELSNDSSVRKQSFSKNYITWDSHNKWFKEKLNEDKSIILIAVDENENRIGIRRFQIMDDKSVLASIIIKKEYRNKGYGTDLIKISNEFLFKNYDVKVHNCYIKPNNIASIKAFEKVGYIRRGLVTRNGEEVIHLTFSRN